MYRLQRVKLEIEDGVSWEVPNQSILRALLNKSLEIAPLCGMTMLASNESRQLGPWSGESESAGGHGRVQVLKYAIPMPQAIHMHILIIEETLFSRSYL